MKELFMEGEIAYGEKDYSRLDWACNRILEHDRDNETALTYKLYICCEWRQHHLVSRIANRIHELYPNNYHAYNAPAAAYLDKMEFKKALKCCEEGLMIKDYNGLKMNKVKSLIGLKRTDEAYEFFKSSHIPGFTFTEALMSCGEYSQIPDYDEGLSKEELLDCFIKRCQYLDGRNRREEIPEVCDEIFRIDEGNETALQYMICSLDDDEEVLRCCDKAIGLYPDNFRFYFQKAETLLWSFKDIGGAIENYERGFALVKEFGKYWADIDNLIAALDKKADLLKESGNYMKAADAYDKMLFYKPEEFGALDRIDSLVCEHGINYRYSQHYRKSLRLIEELEKRLDRIDDYLKAIEVGEYDDKYVDGCSEFKDYKPLSEYIRDIIISLMEAYPEYDEESSRNLVKIGFENVEKSFELGESAYDFAVVYGFSGG